MNRLLKLFQKSKRGLKLKRVFLHTQMINTAGKDTCKKRLRIIRILFCFQIELQKHFSI